MNFYAANAAILDVHTPSEASRPTQHVGLMVPPVADKYASNPTIRGYLLAQALLVEDRGSYVRCTDNRYL
jgi:hypothetical protein